ncbi:MAG: tetratricopeptide (TPR) repeat protein, partial [Polyangiales bacterium]
MRLSVLFLALTMTQGAFAQDEVPAEAASVDVDAAGLDQAARLLFESASRAYEAGNFTDALARYTNAYQLSDRAELLYNIAICHDRLEQKEEAADYYERFVAAVPDSPRVGI